MTALVRSFANRHPAESILQQIHQAVAASKTQLEKNHAEVIDLTDAGPGECFFDLVHLNTCGDDLMASEHRGVAQATHEDAQAGRRPMKFADIRQNLKKDYLWIPERQDCHARRHADPVPAPGAQGVRIRARG